MVLLKRLLFAACGILMLGACAPLRVPIIVKKSPIEMFKYAYISPTKELTSSTGSAYGGQYGIYGSLTTKSVNPSDIIAGILIQNGFIIVPEIKSELAKEMVIVNYGESGKRKAESRIRLHDRGNNSIHIGRYEPNDMLLYRRRTGINRIG